MSVHPHYYIKMFSKFLFLILLVSQTNSAKPDYLKLQDMTNSQPSGHPTNELL